MVLEIAGLKHSFERQAPAAIEIDRLTARPGELTVITGPSGSGKTTLLYLASGLLRAREGRIAWSGIDLTPMGESQRDRWRRDNAGFVFQDFNLIGEMSPRENVTVAAYFGRWSAGSLKARAQRLLAQLGVPDERRPADSFSRGEQQRIALARALLFDPAVIFADEPTASLDGENSEMLAAELTNLALAGRTVLAVSHDPALISRAHSVVRLERGRLAQKDLAA